MEAETYTDPGDKAIVGIMDPGRETQNVAYAAPLMD